MRKHYIDNLRNTVILLLFFVHTFMIWNNFGSKFYIWLGENTLLSTLIVLVNPWFMPLLFVLAGMNAKYSLEKRTVKEFILQRVKKLLLPFLGGLIFLVPFQTLYARKFFYDYDGSIIDNWIYFFTHLTDFSGYDGAFTPGHLWFILFLFIISMVALILFHLFPYDKLISHVEKIPIWGIFFLFIPVWAMYYLGNFGSYSLGKYFALYVIGYYVLSNDLIIKKLEKNIKWIAFLCAISTISSVLLYYFFSFYGDLWVNFTGWISILTLLVFGKKFYNRRTKFTEYFNKTSYSIYIWHQSILVGVAYYVVQRTDDLLRFWGNTPLLAAGVLPIQVFCICMGSFLLTLLVCHLINRRLSHFKIKKGGL